MKKLSYLIVIVLISSLVLTGCSLLSNVGQVPTTEQSGITYLMRGGPTENEADEFVLWAGQNIEVGVVKVWNDTDNLYVKYVITAPDWCLTETHLHVAKDLADIPQTKKNNPIPGQFDYKDEYDCATESYLYEIPLDVDWRCGLYIAAHAVVQSGESQEETAWGGVLTFNDKNWATYINYATPCEYEWPEGGTTTVAFEDLPLDEGNDWDYNDFVVDIDTLATFFGTSKDHKLIQIDFTVRPEAKIAGFWHIMHLAPETFGSDGTYELYHDSALVDSGAYFHSSGFDVIMVPDTASFNTAKLIIYFDPGCDFSFPVWDPSMYHGENLFFDPYIFVNDTSEFIHKGDVRMLAVPTDWQWPTPDGNAIWNAYTKVGATTDPLLGPVFCQEWWTP